jgi:hypothetical protein
MTQVLDQGITEIATQRLHPSFAVHSSDAILMTRAAVQPRSRWDGVVEQLNEWRDQAADDSVSVFQARQQAILFAGLLASDGEPTPSRVGLSNNGGIAFEWERGDALVHIEVLDARHAEYTEFRGIKLVEDAELIWDPSEQVYVPLDS